MIIIDGQRSPLEVHQFENLEQIIEKIMEDRRMHSRIVTDVLVNDEAFSEIYPHQAEDMEASYIKRVEIVSVPASEMAQDITRELYKVVTLMGKAGRQVADLFRQADDDQALELYGDLLDVNRDFLNMVGVLRSEYAADTSEEFEASLSDLSSLFSEMIEIQENEDWILLADLLEYEYLPVVEKTKNMVARLRDSVRTTIRQETNG
ncbi:MAG: hypothetical protein KUA37_03400 [Desulfomicrobium sp.]|nr:hypothetical protein [Pseudomonadota bacterium]MBV1711042.1 hypothetical protein [Desulfomicrobium sp.]MBU4570696.1 hypothetical protein [Pseudomonadota bacterium]MBU4593460.1 hypothetical protein [Pseudomonadota bacterium]MBV1719226.1 hypothetical protein [Desulfomicrobium sp.]